MISTLHAAILGIVEGATEFLPVSSTGHLILASSLLNIPESEFLKTFEISIQLGAIAAVVVMYPRRLLADLETQKRVMAAFIPTAVVGFFLYKLIKTYLLGSALTVVWMMGIGGVAIIAFERWKSRKAKSESAQISDIARLSYFQAVLIGLAQAVAVVPGVSRSAATIVGGMALGVARATIVEFSFLLAVPTIGAAVIYDIYKSGAVIPEGGWLSLAIGFATAFAVALASIRFLIRTVSSGTLVPFGYYRVGAAVVMAFILLR